MTPSSCKYHLGGVAQKILLVAVLLCVPQAAHADCAVLGGCGTSPQTNALIRKYNSGETWLYQTIPNSPYILFDIYQWRTMAQDAIDVYASLNQYMPQDWIPPDPWADSDFRWEWTSQSIIDTDPDRESFPLASTNRFTDDVDHPCRITGARIRMSVDPHDDTGYMCWGEASCFTPYCWTTLCGNDVFDYLSTAVHEYGHSLGLNHSDDASATMYPGAFMQDTLSRTLIGCEATFIANKYRDNFGPSVLNAFNVRRTSPTDLTCEWRAELELGCRAYRLTRQCSDGTSTLLADSVFCQGPGVMYSVTDSPPCSGVIGYTLSLVDSLAPGLLQENVLVERHVEIGGSAPRAVARVATRQSADAEPSGYETPSAVVEALGAAITSRDEIARRRILADGFGYYTRGGLYWGRAIDGILEESMRACLASSDTTLDSLRFKAVETRSLTDNLVEVTADVEYAHKCQAVDATWVGQIVATVERRRIEEGWRIRQIVETR